MLDAWRNQVTKAESTFNSIACADAAFTADPMEMPGTTSDLGKRRMPLSEVLPIRGKI